VILLPGSMERIRITYKQQDEESLTGLVTLRVGRRRKQLLDDLRKGNGIRTGNRKH
jgi:hypothetical protein